MAVSHRSSKQAPAGQTYDRQTLSLDTVRLLMRPVHKADPAAVLALLNQPDVRRYLIDDEIRSPEWLTDFIDASTANFAQRGFGLWSCALRDQPDLMIGIGGFVVFRESGEPEIVYALSPEVWGQGLATEMTEAFIALAFRDLGFDSVIASTDIPNTASVAVMRRAGMSHDYTDRESGVAGEVFYKIMRDDWDAD